MIRNFITQEAKKIILERAYLENYNTPAAMNSASSLDEGNSMREFSLFNLPVWDVIKLKYEPSGLTCTLAIAMITVAQSKNVEKTPIAGAPGTVKEFISAGDGDINIKATIVGNGVDYYPKEDVKSIQKILDIGAAITIESTILNKYMGINNVVITNFDWAQKEEGMRNVQSLNIELITDNPELYKMILGY